MNKFYNLLEAKFDSKEDFIAFMRYMIEERAYVNGMGDDVKKDFMYHFDKLPDYTNTFIQEKNERVRKHLGTIGLAYHNLLEVTK